MKSGVIKIIKVLSFSIVLSSLVFELPAINKTLPKSSNIIVKEHTLFNELEIIEEQKEIESWMFNLELQQDETTDQSSLEEWMFDENFWEIKTNVWEEEVIEEPREIEDWMNNLKVVKKRSSKFFLNFREEQWLKKHAFVIL